MLEIQEKFDTEGYEDIIAAAGVDNIHITEAMDKGKSIGYIAYAYETECTVVYGYDDGGDLMLCDGLVRSVMFKSVLKGIETMIFKLPDKDGFVNLRKLKFLEGDSTICENLDGFMNACKNCRRGEI
ncbi:MAG: hypothetical protein K2J26_04350 [Ruminococcus sp.]|nr:hypothetical protein [Ruminococcus sp.]